ncbi:hypothetical protein CFOL_v3_02643, partial [Cephalotus follicularis]
NAKTLLAIEFQYINKNTTRLSKNTYSHNALSQKLHKFSSGEVNILFSLHSMLSTIDTDKNPKVTVAYQLLFVQRLVSLLPQNLQHLRPLTQLSSFCLHHG